MDEAEMAAAERLDAFSDLFARDAVIDAKTGLTRADLDLLLTRLGVTRNAVMIRRFDMSKMTRDQIDQATR